MPFFCVCVWGGGGGGGGWGEKNLVEIGWGRQNFSSILCSVDGTDKTNPVF
jgi:hypothetical protein